MGAKGPQSRQKAADFTRTRGGTHTALQGNELIDLFAPTGAAGAAVSAGDTAMASAIIDRIEGRARDLGGFSVRRILPVGHRKTVGPFIFFDHMGPVALPPGAGMDVRPHPHIGLATVTYLFEGSLMHRDSLGSVQLIEPGAVNWMTAGRGIAHSERSSAQERARGVRLHGIQSWVALPRELEETEPAFAHHPASSLPQLQRNGATLRIIAGAAYGAMAPVKVSSPTLYVDAQLQAGAQLQLPAEHEQRAVYPVDAAVIVAGERGEPGSLVVLAPGAPVTLDAPAAARVMLLGGAPLDGERFIWWNFVSSSQERIEQAKADWRAQRFAGVAGETEFIPLPEL
jgi:redox-sensitive bicupin YhaK (pirin superfamily)